MTTLTVTLALSTSIVVEAYRLDRYDNSSRVCSSTPVSVVEAYRLDRYDNFVLQVGLLEAEL